ncbi:hypothetical protein Syun_000332 [Stephania yunnanensis]|uniref:Josephin-like protein n=1 Tax=Stephania yunnanensis TaxID=152371 RepID=A0AAP0LBR4_9MAGN
MGKASLVIRRFREAVDSAHTKVASALQLVSLRKGSSSSSTNTPPPPKKCNMERSRSFVAPVVDSHRSKAIEDCIEFINSSSLQRSNSVSVN